MLKEIASAINEHVTIKTTIDIKDEEITMMVVFSPKVEDGALSGIPPIIISGTPEEAQSEFLQFIKSPSVEQITTTASGVSDFEKAAQKAAEENKVAKDLKDKIDKLAEKGAKFVTDGNLINAEKTRDEILTLNPKPKGKKWTDFNKSVVDKLKKEQKTQGLFSNTIDEERQEAIEQERLQKLYSHADIPDNEDF